MFLSSEILRAIDINICFSSPPRINSSSAIALPWSTSALSITTPTSPAWQSIYTPDISLNFQLCTHLYTHSHSSRMCSCLKNATSQIGVPFFFVCVCFLPQKVLLLSHTLYTNLEFKHQAFGQCVS